MSVLAIKKMELMEKVSSIPEHKLGELETFLQKILSQSDIRVPQPRSLKGIWKNKGFENISNLEFEIKKLRKRLDDTLLKRDL